MSQCFKSHKRITILRYSKVKKSIFRIPAESHKVAPQTSEGHFLLSSAFLISSKPSFWGQAAQLPQAVPTIALSA